MVEQLNIKAIMAVLEESVRVTPPKSKEKQEMLWQGVEKSGVKLSESEKNQLYQLLHSYICSCLLL